MIGFEYDGVIIMSFEEYNLYLLHKHLQILLGIEDYESAARTRDIINKIQITMKLHKAFKHLVKNWNNQSDEFRNKYRVYKSRFLNDGPVSDSKIREILIEAGYSEEWITEVENEAKKEVKQK